MGIFSKELDSSLVLSSTFMTISQAIKVGEDLGMYRDVGIDRSDFWALYLRALEPFAEKPDELHPHHLSMLRYANTSAESIKYAKNIAFIKSVDDFELFTIAVAQTVAALEAKFLDLNSMHNEEFTNACIDVMTNNYKKCFPETFANDTSVLIYILTLALRSILLDTLKINGTEKNQRRKSGFFWISLMLVNWNYKCKLS